MPATISQTTDIATCHALRRAVFIIEQGVPDYEDIDGLDDQATHLLASKGKTPIGTARLMIKGDTGKIGRVCVLPEHRGTGTGAALIRAAQQHLTQNPAVKTLYLSAQVDSIPFYERLGFAAHGPEYDDAGILHRDMSMEASP